MSATEAMPQDRRDAILATQVSEWPRHVAGAKAGNPYATLCSRCFGRHEPPRDEICPGDAPGKGAT